MINFLIKNILINSPFEKSNNKYYFTIYFK